MAIFNEGMTLGDLKGALDNMEADDSLKIRFSTYDGTMQVFSIRKFTETDENGDIADAYIVLNA